MVDVSPIIPVGRQVIETYGDGRFRISGAVYRSSVIVHPDRTTEWPVATWSDVSEAELIGQLDTDAVDVLLVGCGERAAPLPRPLRAALRENGIVAEPMGTGAACRTFNVLMAEGRQVAAALLAVD